MRDFVFPENDRHCQAAVLKELPTLREGAKYCTDFRVAVQAGGNAGVFPVFLSCIFEHVYTFEPEPENFRCLTKNVIEKNIFMFPAALGFIHGTRSLDGPQDNAGAWQLAGNGPIPVLNIDDLGLHACDFIQLDVEGMELEAIKGGIYTIGKYKPVIMFEDRGISERYGTKAGETEKFLAIHGYEVVERTKRDVICRVRP